MAGWAAVLSLLAIGLRLAQVDSFIGKHRDQVPPLARAPSPGTLEIVFVDAAAGRYALDLVQNDPFLRGARITMVYRGPEDTANLMRQRFPSYHKSAEGRWGELWARPQQAPAN